MRKKIILSVLNLIDFRIFDTGFIKALLIDYNNKKCLHNSLEESFIQHILAPFDDSPHGLFRPMEQSLLTVYSALNEP